MTIRPLLVAAILTTLVVAESIAHAADIQSLDLQRSKAIAQALGVSEDRVAIKNGTGKVNADQTHKLSYFIFTPDPANAGSETTLIPLATSRFDAYNYSTDEWWDAHKEEIAKARERGTAPPRQDPQEVQRFLRANNLSINPDVVILNLTESGTKPSVRRIKLQEFLTDYFLQRAGTDTHVTIFRGAEKAGELNSWKQGIFPRGVRYWTPDAVYAWRYARKNPNLIPDLVRGEAPLFKFRIPREMFVTMVQRGDLVLGCEMTKKAHDLFSARGQFVDHLAEGEFYLGDGVFGLEVEIRGARGGRQIFPKFFQGAITVEELAHERRFQIERGTDRLKKQYPEAASELDLLKKQRLERLKSEESILVAIRDQKGAKFVHDALNALPLGIGEMTYVDSFNFSAFAKEHANGIASKDACGKIADQFYMY